MRFMQDLNADFIQSCELVDVQALTPPGQAKIVRFGKGGAPVVSDGPFAAAAPPVGLQRDVRVRS